jgi:hypothetical protein
MTPSPFETRASRRDWIVAVLVVVATAVVSTWPLATSPWLIPEHQDPLFSSWRIYQSARNLAGGAWSLFDGNIFHPAADVTLYSDPIALPVVVSAPFVWAGAPAVLVYSTLFWASAISAGLAMFACARAVSGSQWGGLVAAAMFVGAPLRLEHVMHLEMLWTAFLPLTVLATMRAFEGRPRATWAVGALLAGQFLCGIYAGVFLLTAWPVLAGVEWLRRRGDVPRAAMWRLSAALALAAIVIALYARPFQAARAVVGDRGDAEVASYGATLASYTMAPPSHRLWGWTSDPAAAEKRLSPGALGTTFGLVALTTPAAPWVAALAVTTGLAVEASRGVQGWIYPVLRRFATPYRGLRVPARFAMVALTGLALLAAIGCGRLGRLHSHRRGAAVLAAAVVALVVAESSVALPVRRLPASPPPVYALLGTMPPGVIIHLPLPEAGALPGAEPNFQYFAEHHQHRLINGYSGFYPPPYLRLLDRARAFPDDRSMNAIRAMGAEYVLVHEQYYPTRAAFAAVVAALEQRRDAVPVATSFDDGGAVWVYRLPRD